MFVPGIVKVHAENHPRPFHNQANRKKQPTPTYVHVQARCYGYQAVCLINPFPRAAISFPRGTSNVAYWRLPQFDHFPLVH